MTTWLACGCWVTWGIIVVLIESGAFAERTQLAIRGSIAVLLLGSLAIYQVKTILIVFRYNHSVINDINSLEVQRLMMREKKVLTDTRITLAIFSLLFIPTAILSVTQPSGLYANVVFPWSMAITLLNSSINPLIQLWRNRRLLRVITESLLGRQTRPWSLFGAKLNYIYYFRWEYAQNRITYDTLTKVS